jgi:hypothetical protein
MKVPARERVGAFADIAKERVHSHMVVTISR